MLRQNFNFGPVLTTRVSSSPIESNFDLTIQIFLGDGDVIVTEDSDNGSELDDENNACAVDTTNESIGQSQSIEGTTETGKKTETSHEASGDSDSKLEKLMRQKIVLFSPVVFSNLCLM